MNYFNETNMSEAQVTNNYETNTSFNGGECCGMMNCCPSGPIYECPQERVCHRYTCYEVPHIMPMNTRIINHHIYKHTFRPEYTCCEENVCENIYEPRCF